LYGYHNAQRTQAVGRLPAQRNQGDKMHQLTGTRQKTKGNPPGKKLTFPPAVGTFEENQKHRAMLIAKQHATQYSVHPTKIRWAQLWDKLSAAFRW